ncbi:MAG: dicarboxylate/amino acid:cation symporter [Pseudomonadales bacterium]|nr:dicarboxylate/amino acid:cation symporter [Pseudomonadales bacterium]
MDHSKLTKQILTAMFVGILLGAGVHSLSLAEDNFILVYLIDGLFDLGGDIFVKSLKLLVVPIVFVSLVCGASNLGDNASMGRIGLKTIGLYLMTTAIAITLAITAAVIIQPGVGINLSTDLEFVAKESPPFKEVLLNIFPSNPIAAMAEGKMLQIIVFAILVGIAISKSGEAGQRIRQHLDDWNDVIMNIVMMLMKVAPIGVFCLLVTLFAQMGFSAIQELIVYFMTVLMVLVLHFVLTYGGMIRVLANLSPVKFFRHMAPVLAYGFSTSSSNATLPMTLETVEHKIGVKNEIASFTVPLGATINMDGTAIMQGVATVFIAQAFNQDLSLADYITVILTATMASIGTAGVPGVGLIMLALVLQQVGLPVEGIALIIGVDRLLDMTRTAVNVTGDAAVSAIVAKSEGKFSNDVFEGRAASDTYSI